MRILLVVDQVDFAQLQRGGFAVRCFEFEEQHTLGAKKQPIRYAAVSWRHKLACVDTVFLCPMGELFLYGGFSHLTRGLILGWNGALPMRRSAER